MGKTRSARKAAEFKQKIEASAASHTRFQTNSGNEPSSSDNEELRIETSAAPQLVVSHPPFGQAICGLPSPAAMHKTIPPKNVKPPDKQTQNDCVMNCGKEPLPSSAAEPTPADATTSSAGNSNHLNHYTSLANRIWSNFKSNTALKECMQLKVNKSTGKSVNIMQEDIYGIEEGWGVCLAGYIAGRFPGREAIKKKCDKWGVKYSSMFSSSGWMLFRFQSSEDKAKVLRKGPYLVYGIPLMLKSVDEDFDIDDAEAHTVPVWIRIIHLPLHFWTDSCLSKIGSKFGTPVCADELTTTRKRLDFARLLVEVDLEQDLPKIVSITKPNGQTKTLAVEFEYLPTFCKSCKVFGHKQEECKGRLGVLNRTGKGNDIVQKETTQQGPKPAQFKPIDQTQAPQRTKKDETSKEQTGKLDIVNTNYKTPVATNLEVHQQNRPDTSRQQTGKLEIGSRNSKDSVDTNATFTTMVQARVTTQPIKPKTIATTSRAKETRRKQTSYQSNQTYNEAQFNLNSSSDSSSESSSDDAADGGKPNSESGVGQSQAQKEHPHRKKGIDCSKLWFQNDPPYVYLNREC